MNIQAVKTRKLLPPQDNLLTAIQGSIPKLKENSIVCIASKVVSLHQGRCIPISEVESKDQLIMQNSDLYLPREKSPNSWVMHTITNNIFLPSAGIDESNANGYYILWPKDVKKAAKDLWSFLRKRYGVKNLGVIITDSHSIPLRRGLVGISLAHFGFQPLHDYRGQMDLFNRELKVSLANFPDSLAATAVLQMGEGAEGTPIVVITDVPRIKFSEKEFKSDVPYSSFEVPLEEDLFAPILTSVKWKKGGK